MSAESLKAVARLEWRPTRENPDQASVHFGDEARISIRDEADARDVLAMPQGWRRVCASVYLAAINAEEA